MVINTNESKVCTIEQIELLSVYILEELLRVLPRLAHRHDLTLAEIDDLVDVLSIQADVIDPLPGMESELRDINDPPVSGTLLAAIKASNTDYPIIRHGFTCFSKPLSIVAPAKFWTTHAGL